MSNKLKILIFLLIIFTFVSCGKSSESKNQGRVRSQSISQVLAQKSNELVTDPRKPMAWGHQQTIYVFADNDVWTVNEPYLRYSLERYFFTTENEQLFEIKHGDIKNINQFFRFKNLIFLCDINSNQAVSQYVKDALPEQAILNVAERKSSMFMNNNLWANDQLVMFFLGDSAESIKNHLYNNNDTYFQIFKDRFISRITFQSQKLKGYKDSFFNEMPFKMYIPETYRVFRRDLENNFISFIWRSRENQEKNPDKYISIYWEYADENPLNDNWLLKKRKDLAWKYYDEDEFDPDGVMRGLKDFNQYEAWFMSGMWQNKKYFMGGAFQSFAFYNDDLKIVYLIDTSVYFPAGYKLRYLLELEGIVKTIMPKSIVK